MSHCGLSPADYFFVFLFLYDLAQLQRRHPLRYIIFVMRYRIHIYSSRFPFSWSTLTLDPFCALAHERPHVARPVLLWAWWRKDIMLLLLNLGEYARLLGWHGGDLQVAQYRKHGGEIDERVRISETLSINIISSPTEIDLARR